MKSILVLITSSVSNNANASSALKYIKAALLAGHKVDVFFYGNAIHDCNQYTSPLSDEMNITREYMKLEHEQNLQLLVCNTAASRRGLLPEEEAHEQGFNLQAPFIAAGLTEFATLSQSADKMVQF
ncbi:MAG: sulfurtransferase complex subunit TusD [Alteromonadaceae bacterium]|nr:sulfurtransferase complex subunit TusD [Alteromonadaceae bacterium]